MSKSPDAFRTISEVADDLEIPKHVLRFWEIKFNQIRPMKRGGGRRYYRPQDVELLRGIHGLLHAAGYTIRGVQKILREQGIDAVKHHADAAGVGLPSGEAVAPSRQPAPGRILPRSPSSAGGAKTGRPPVGNPAIGAIIRELEQCLALLRDEPLPAATRRPGSASR